MSEYIPFEIQEEILKRLPLKPLIQFRSVSKSYKGLIDSPDFVVSYSAHHPQPDDRFILSYKRDRNDRARISVPWKVQVFTLSTGTWSILSTNLPRESIRLRGSQVVIDRFIYWLAFDKLDAEDGRSQSRYLIMSFDLIAKEFKEISLTGSLTNRLCHIQSISKLRESLVLLEYHGEFEEDVSVCCLWMMKEQGVSRSFTKLYNVNLPDATIHQILGFTKTGELIIETRQEFDRHGEVQIYKRHHDYADNLGIDGEEYSFFMCSYMETLLLLDQSDVYKYIFQ